MHSTLRPRDARGHFQHGWLETYHTFSFGHYFDPDWSSYRSLRVMNEDVVAPGQGFGTHGHQDMEILTWVLSGELEHRDSLGHGEKLRPGEMQWMSAGSGIRHSEFNPSADQPTHLYQIWLLPDRKGHTPGYEQRAFPAEGRRNRFQVLAAGDHREGALPIRQDATVAVATFEAGVSLDHPWNPDRHGWLQVLKGRVAVAGQHLAAGDGLGFSETKSLTVVAEEPAEVLLFDLA